MSGEVVCIRNASLEDDDTIGDQIIIRGVIEQATLKNIHLDWYQRERGFSDSHTNEIIAALFAGNKLADITLGMRGQRVKSKGDTYLLLDKCFCIDGGQRLWATAMAVKERPDLKISLGAKVYLGTNEEVENDLFCRLGTTQVKIAPSILLRNRKKKSPAAKILVTLNSHPDFALKDRVAWDQRKTRHELVHGYTVARIVGALHAHLGGGLKNSKVYELLLGLDSLVDKIGEAAVAANTIRFFDAIDKCWSIRHMSGARNEPRPHLKPAFLMTIARLFSKYAEFWDGTDRHNFYCPDKYTRKLRTFPLSKYVVSTIYTSEALYEILRKHVGLAQSYEAPPFDEAAE